MRCHTNPAEYAAKHLPCINLRPMKNTAKAVKVEAIYVYCSDHKAIINAVQCLNKKW